MQSAAATLSLSSYPASAGGSVTRHHEWTLNRGGDRQAFASLSPLGEPVSMTP